MAPSTKTVRSRRPATPSLPSDKAVTQTELSSFFSVLAKPNQTTPKTDKDKVFVFGANTQTTTTPHAVKKLKLAQNGSALSVKTSSSISITPSNNSDVLSPFQKLVLKRKAEKLELDQEDMIHHENVPLFAPKQTETSFHLQRKPILATPSKSATCKLSPVLVSTSDASPKNAPIFPSNLLLLQKIFHALEATLAFHANREKPPTFHTLRKPVQNSTGRDFDLLHLGMILSLYPSAYCLTPVRILVDPDIGLKEDSVMIEMIKLNNTENMEKEEASTGGILVGDGKTVFEREKPFAEALERRRAVFRKACLRHVAQAHESFLASLSESERVKYTPTQSNDVSSDKEVRWHPDFDLETQVPEVSPLEIPTVCSVTITDADCAPSSTPPSDTKLDSSGAILDSSDTLPPNLSDSTTCNSSETTAIVAPEAKDANPAVSEPALPQKPLSRAAALLQRIKEKERQKSEMVLHVPKYTASDLKRRAMISRLVEVGRSVMAYFTSKRTSALPMKEVCEYVMTGVRNSISYEESREHVILLSETCPEWCTVTKLQVGTIVKFNATVPDMIIKLRSKVKELLEGGESKTLVTVGSVLPNGASVS